MNTIKKLVLGLKEELSAKVGNVSKRKVTYKVDRIKNFDKRIIFLLPNLNYPCGGNIVVHRLCEELNVLNIKGYKSYILYPDKPKFRTKWFEHTAPHKTDLLLNPATDFVIIPEIYAAKHGKLLRDLKVNYAINVANGYLMDFEIRHGSASYDDLRYSYENANLILAISDDAASNVELVFPINSSKIMKSSYVINKAVFRSMTDKKNRITYMPRKLSSHVKILLFFLNRHLPPHWELQPIDGVKESVVYEMLSDSKIFLSFSEFEGLAMPPVMAALSGNHVIGYTGEGNKEYFVLSCFTEVYCGDVKQFIKEILLVIDKIDKGEYKFDMASFNELTKMFSEDKQKQYLIGLVENIEKLQDAKLSEHISA